MITFFLLQKIKLRKKALKIRKISGVVLARRALAALFVGASERIAAAVSPTRAHLNFLFTTFNKN